MTVPDLNLLFGAAQQDGMLSSGGLQALALHDLGAQIQAGLGVSVDNVTASEVILVALLIDDSSSINYVAGNAAAVRDGVNTILTALSATKQADQILAYASMLNRGLVHPFCSIKQARKLDAKNYRPSGSTPLYDQTAVVLGTVAAKVQEFADAGVPARAVSILITDGADCGSSTHRRPEAVSPVVSDLLRTEMHLVIGMGIDDGSTDFRDIFGRMGLRPEWILTPKNSPSEIRKACAMVSQSAVRASQAAPGPAFSSALAGGFGTYP